MKNKFHKISSFLMALLVLFSTFSFAVEKHYCGDILVDSSFIGHVKSCGMEMHNSSFTSDDCSIATKNCCHDEKVVVNGHDDLMASYVELNFQQQLFVASLAYTYFNLFIGNDKKVIPFEDYSPPFLVKNLQLLDEVFLI